MEESRLLRLPAVLKITGLKKSTVYANAKAGTFPKPVRLGSRAVAWRADELKRWIDELPRAVS
ncbi:MAG: AlpA family phage regulatory protein [Bacteroidetes bacterium]|nr:AlpA family phage regulatory protein [Bacteroidota bacterium]